MNIEPCWLLLLVDEDSSDRPLRLVEFGGPSGDVQFLYGDKMSRRQLVEYVTKHFAPELIMLPGN